MEAFSALMNEATDLLLLSVAAAAKEGKYLDIYQAIGRMTLQVVGTTAFGYAADSPLMPFCTEVLSPYRLHFAVPPKL